MTDDDLYKTLKDLQAKSGYSQFHRVTQKISRERIQNATRDKRIKFRPKTYQQLFDKQGGKCPVCKFPLLVPAKHNEVDHVNPEEQNFNHFTNLQLLHPRCNKEKSSKNMLQQSKERGETMTDILMIQDADGDAG